MEFRIRLFKNKNTKQKIYGSYGQPLDEIETLLVEKPDNKTIDKFIVVEISASVITTSSNAADETITLNLEV